MTQLSLMFRVKQKGVGKSEGKAMQLRSKNDGLSKGQLLSLN